MNDIEKKKEQARERVRRYRERHPDKVKESQKKYRERHPKTKEMVCQYRIKNLERMRERERRYYNQNIEKIKEYRSLPEVKERTRQSAQKYRMMNPEKVQETNRKSMEQQRERRRGSADVREKDKNRVKQWSKIDRLRCGDTYIKSVLSNQYGLKRLQIPPELIEAKRLLIQLKRGGYNDCFKKNGRGV